MIDSFTRWCREGSVTVVSSATIVKAQVAATVLAEVLMNDDI